MCVKFGVVQSGPREDSLSLRRRYLAAIFQPAVNKVVKLRYNNKQNPAVCIYLRMCVCVYVCVCVSVSVSVCVGNGGRTHAEQLQHTVSTKTQC